MTQKFTPHILALSALTTLGNAIIVMSNLNVINLFISLVLSLAMILFVSFLFNRTQKNKISYLGLLLFICVIALYSAAATFIDYIEFLKTHQLPQSSTWLLMIVFMAVIVACATSKIKVIYKYSLFAFVIITAMLLLCFVGGIKNFDYQNFNSKTFDVSFSLKNFLRFFASVTVLTFFVKTDKKDVKPVFFGVSVGFAMLLIALLQTIFTIDSINALDFPYLKSVSVISSGSLFTRLDGIVWFIFFVSALIKSVLCIKVVLKSMFQNIAFNRKLWYNM